MEDKKNIQWPGWETVRLIGRGSYGAVYEIERDLFGKKEKAALKHIRIPQNPSDIEEMYSDGYDDESITATFQSHLESIVAEYSLMRKLNGAANVVNCDDVQYVQREDGIGWDVFIKMELLTPLTKALPDPIPEETVVKIAKDLCQALSLCKRFDIIHRDIKPQNIFVSPLGDYKLGDFGIAKTVEKTMGGTKTGTYKYMAPEVYNNRPYGQQVDIYSLGLVLYWMLNRKRMPFLPLPPARLTAGMDEQARNRRLSGEPLPAPADGSEELKRIVLKACAYDPAERYHTADEMLADLNALEDERSRPAVRLTSPAQDSQPIPQPATLADEEGTVGAFGRSSATAGASIARPTGPLDEDEATVGAFGAAAHNASANPEAAQKPAPGSPEPKPLAAEPKAAHAIDSAKIADTTVLKTKKKSRTPLIAAIAAVLAIVIGLVIWKPWASNEDQSQSDDNLYSSATEEKLDIEGTTKPTIQPTIDVTVPTDVLLNISIFTMPSQTEYFVGDTLDTTGLQLRTNNSSGTSETISGGFSCSPMTLDSSGTQTITVSYGGKTTTFSVFVNPNPEGTAIDTIGLKSALDDCLRGTRGEWQVMVIDPDTGSRVHSTSNCRVDEYMAVNRMVEVFIMGTVFQYAEDGTLLLEDYIEDIKSMITANDANAADRLIEALGGGNAANGRDAVKAFALENGFKIGFNRSISDSESTKNNYVSSQQTAEILELIYTGKLVSEFSSRQMMDILLTPSDSTERDIGLAGYSGCIYDVEDGLCVCTLGIVQLSNGRSFIISVICDEPENKAKNIIDQLIRYTAQYFK